MTRSNEVEVAGMQGPKGKGEGDVLREEKGSDKLL